MTKEVYFHGELSHGRNFNIGSEGLCCEMLVIKDESWEDMNEEDAQ